MHMTKYLGLLVGASLSLLILLFSGLKILLIFCCNFGLLLLDSEPFALELGGGCFLTGVLFLAGLLGAFEGTGGAAFFGGFGFALDCAFCFFLGSSFLRSSFFGAESELELVLDTRVLLTFLWLAGLIAEACELSESELLESLPDDDEDELSLLLLELESSDVLT